MKKGESNPLTGIRIPFRKGDIKWTKEELEKISADIKRIIAPKKKEKKWGEDNL